MRAPLLSALVLALAATPACIQEPSADGNNPDAGMPAAPKDAAEVLTRYVQALGGETLLRGLEQRTVEARVIFVADEDCAPGDPGCIAEETEGQFVLYATADGRLFRRMVVGERMDERGFDGKTGWNLGDGVDLSIEDEATSLASREDALLHWYLDYAERGIEPSLIEDPRTVGSDGVELTLDGVRWQAAAENLPERVMWFDRATGLLREEIEQVDEQQRVVIIYGEYEDVDGTPVPRSIRQLETRGEDTNEIDIRVSSVNHRPLREGLFDVPQLPPPEPQPDAYLEALAAARRATVDDPKDLQAWMGLVRVAFAVAHFDEAKKAAEKALGIDGKEPEAMWTLGRIALLRGQFKEATKWLDKAAAVGLRPEEYARNMAWILAQQKKWERVGDALRASGQADLAGIYDALPGKPLDISFAKRGCSASTPMQISEAVGAPIFSAKIEGREVKLMLDTSSRDIILAEPIARELLITRDTESPLGATTSVPVPHGFIETLEIGELSIKNLPTAVVPAQALSRAADGVDGVLGARALLDLQLVLDHETDSLELVSSEGRCSKQAKANRKGASAEFIVHESHFVYVLSQLNESEAVFLLNTGMRGADVAASSGAYARAGISIPPVIAGERTLAKIRRMGFGEQREVGNLQGAYGVFEGEATADNFRLDGMMGLGALGPGRVVIDFPQRTIYFGDSEGSPEAKAAPAKAATTSESKPKSAEPPTK